MNNIFDFVLEKNRFLEMWNANGAKLHRINKNNHFFTFPKHNSALNILKYAFTWGNVGQD